MKANSIPQISGNTGKLVGVVAVQTNGSLTIKLVGDTLQTKSEEFFGLETKEIVVPIQDVKGVEIGEGCTWSLFWLAIPTVFLFASLPMISNLAFIGIIFIVLALIIKQRYIAIYTTRTTLILFYQKSERVEQFRSAVIEACRPKPISISRPSPPPLPPPPHSLPK
ncbi:hypothetical protein NG798_03100 [Ancylothrix sp. C2]|uniref:hypothetical protein n=1 Tax=Ancylothrix sp. D3o TaxID=2953691 RepID=UPI0021BA3DC8|nr:hypothetical protein [Ancylothrix sp. D3o]MCT7948766.1 hypothetical protein [Ancylothrix sp. D3o]